MSRRGFASSLVCAWASAVLAVEDYCRLTFGRLAWQNGDDLVTFPIATFNRIGILVDRTIPSILAQTHRNIEIVVVADGTPESQLSRLRDISDPRVRIVRLSKRTKYPRDPVARWMVAGWKPRNVGSRIARGGWIYWISDDDVVLPHAVEALLAVAKTGGYESVSGAYQQGILKPRICLPVAGFEAVGFDITGPPAWLLRRYVGQFRWNRSSWRKHWNRPSDYDLMKRMEARGARFGHTEQLVAVQPEVDGTGKTGLLGALEASPE